MTLGTLVLVAGCACGLGYVLAPSAQLARTNRTTLTELSKKVETLAAQMPVWVTNMESIAAECAEVLESAERRRKRAAASESRSRRSSESDQEQPPGLVPVGDLDPATARAQILARARAARGGRI